MQSRFGSAAEAAANVAISYVIALLAQAMIFPAFDIQVGLEDHARIAAAFTAVSLVRSYLLRRAFNAAASRRRQ